MHPTFILRNDLPHPPSKHETNKENHSRILNDRHIFHQIHDLQFLPWARHLCFQILTQTFSFYMHPKRLNKGKLQK